MTMIWKKNHKMKLRIFEVVAGKSLLLTEHAEDLEDYFEIGKEIETFFYNTGS